MKNTEWKWVGVCLILAVVFFVLIFVAGGSMDGMSGGYAVSFISFFLMLSALAVTVLFFTRARAMDDILGGKDLLAQWVYPEDETRKSAERELADYKESNRALLYVVGGFLVIAMIGVLILGGDGGPATAGILFVVLIIIGIVSVVAPRLEYRRALNAPREAYITDKGLIYEGAVYPFHSFLMKMDGVSYEPPTKKNPPLVVFSFMQLVGLFILRPFTISIPVPPGEEKNAMGILVRLGGTLPEESDPVTPGGMCNNCGEPMEAGERYCESCGERNDPPPGNSGPGQVCPGCGARVNAGTKFCGSCGSRIE